MGGAGWESAWRWRAAIFDLDGTLVDSRAAVVDAVAAGIREILETRGVVDVSPDPASIRRAMGLPSRQYYETILPPTLHHLLDEVQAAATRHEIDALAQGGGQLYPGVLSTLESLRAHDIVLGVISNAQTGYFRAALKHLKLAPLLHHSECYEELPPTARPPKELLLERALAALGCGPAQALMVGDRKEDLEAGRALGCSTVGILGGFGASGELSGADLLVQGVKDLLAC